MKLVQRENNCNLSYIQIALVLKLRINSALPITVSVSYQSRLISKEYFIEIILSRK